MADRHSPSRNPRPGAPAHGDGLPIFAGERFGIGVFAAVLIGLLSVLLAFAWADFPSWYWQAVACAMVVAFLAGFWKPELMMNLLAGLVEAIGKS